VVPDPFHRPGHRRRVLPDLLREVLLLLPAVWAVQVKSPFHPVRTLASAMVAEEPREPSAQHRELEQLRVRQDPGREPSRLPLLQHQRRRVLRHLLPHPRQLRRRERPRYPCSSGPVHPVRYRYSWARNQDSPGMCSRRRWCSEYRPSPYSD
jgi:hypothetical protein